MDAVTGRCPERPNLAAFVTGSVSASEHEAIAAHIAGCADCQHELDAIAPVLPMLDRIRDSDLDDVEVPEGLRDRVLATVERAGTAAVLESIRDLSVGPMQGAATVSSPATPIGEAGVPSARRRRLFAAAAAAVLVIGVGVGWRARSTRRGGEQISMQTLTARDRVVAVGKVRTNADGTIAELVVRNSIPDAVYGVWFEDNTGKRIPLGSFRGRSGEIRFRGETGVRRNDIRAVGAWSNGGDVARADMPPKPKSS